MTTGSPKINSRIRQERILSYLEGAKVPRSLTQITDHLNARAGWEVSRKTVERDIDQLTQLRSVEESSGHPKGFRIRDLAGRKYPLELTREEVHTLSVALALLSQQAPRPFRALVESLETSILRSLASPFNRELESFVERCVARGSTGGRPTVHNEQDIRQLLRALREEKRVHLTYSSPYDGKKPRRGIFGLISLEVFGGSYYMLVEDLEEEEADSRMKRLALPRISSVEVQPDDYARPAKARMKAFEGSFAGLGGDRNAPTKLKITCGGILGKHLEEQELHPSQIGRRLKNGDYVYELQLPIGLAIIRFLCGFAFDLIKVEPSSVAAMVREKLEEGIDRV